jgi:hypothetical protein
MQTFQVNSHINENGILSVKLPKEWAEKDVNVVLDLEPGRVRIAYLSQMPDNSSVALQIRIFENFLLMAVMVGLGWYTIHILLLLYALTEAEISIIEGKKP